MKKTEPKERRTIWTDADVAEFFGLNLKTLQRRMRKPVTGELELAKAEPKIIGSRRFWVRDNVLRLAGVIK
jgi:hypothetical protein